MSLNAPSASFSAHYIACNQAYPHPPSYMWTYLPPPPIPLGLNSEDGQGPEAHEPEVEEIPPSSPCSIHKWKKGSNRTLSCSSKKLIGMYCATVHFLCH